MNAYVMFLNGLLLPPSLFDVEPGNSSSVGRFLRLTIDREKLRPWFKTELRDIDILEVRASNIIHRYRWAKGDGDVKELAGDKVQIQFQCLTVANDF